MMDAVKVHMDLLGKQGRDKVTGAKGVITCVSFDLYGCIQLVLTPRVKKDGKPEVGTWFDVTRIEITDKKPVMDLPDYNRGYVAEGRKGAAPKPKK